MEIGKEYQQSLMSTESIECAGWVQVQTSSHACDASTEEIAKVVSDAERSPKRHAAGVVEFIVYIFNSQPIIADQSLKAVCSAKPRPASRVEPLAKPLST